MALKSGLRVASPGVAFRLADCLISKRDLIKLIPLLVFSVRAASMSMLGRYILPHCGRASQIIALIAEERTTHSSMLAHSLPVPHTPDSLSRHFRALSAGKEWLVWMIERVIWQTSDYLLYLRLLWPKMSLRLGPSVLHIPRTTPGL